MKNLQHTLWVEKYRPVTLENYVCDKDLKKKIESYIEKNDIPHLLLYGPPGTGKTTLAKNILASNLNCTTLYINASSENGIDTIRDNVNKFSKSASFKPLKVVILDEADHLTSAAQASLRNIMETYSKNTRFILTCNYVDKISDPIMSRCSSILLTPPSKADIARHIYNILLSEQIEFEITDLKDVVENMYPDIRRMINFVDNASIDGQLVMGNAIQSSNYIENVMEELKKPTTSSWESIRQIIADNSVTYFEPLYTYLYKHIDDYDQGKTLEIMPVIGDHLFKHTTIVDKEINVMTMFSEILRIIK